MMSEMLFIMMLGLLAPSFEVGGGGGRGSAHIKLRSKSEKCGAERLMLEVCCLRM